MKKENKKQTRAIINTN